MKSERLNDKDLALMERLMLDKQEQVRKYLITALKKYYSKGELIYTHDYIIGKGNIPIAVAAHMDTVWETSTHHEVFYDERKNVMLNLQGGGYDDKVGIFLILKILQAGFKPHVIFCANEEVGSLGAEALIKDYPACPFDDCRFIIMLDRRGLIDCVFYDCENEEFTKYVEEFGFKEAYGSFTDICTLCPAWGMAGVNLSVGYDNEHTVNEKLYVGPMFATFNKVKNILSQKNEDIKYFKYIPGMYSWRGWYGSYGRYAGGYEDYPGWDDDYYGTYGKGATESEGGWFPKEAFGGYCENCGEDLKEKDAIEYYTLDGNMAYCCPKCAKKLINYCEICGSAYEIDPKHPERRLCPDCFVDVMSGKWYDYDGYEDYYK